ncbi:chromosome segregation protein SMC [Alkalihalobacillus sp. 1P02AB]|uniref:chromosome segregation protein SMC n=1 Tax=Alkalihalobacillus sp. 1P02AB TaxID=3132260 RepID=UPI0039A6C4C4
MFLKRLEVVGFKSFAEQIGVDFVPGVTAVVGPNGSGKSNISDSIRWVLGEQSAKSLRGSKMEDIIFAGSDSRKPLNYAEVSLVLDNADGHLAVDYTEVSVTRRVYRSGESEYLINKQTCRLKDIVDLFLDSGLGREAYSIIGQGKVEEILSSKSEDRRVIFEEAAGVLKYKTRKVKAEKRLTETQDNLNRVEDILYELEGQVEPLHIQSSIAKDFLEKKEQLKEIEIALLVYQITDLHQKWTSEKEKLGQLKEQHQIRSKQVKEMEDQLESLRVQSQQLQEILNQTQEDLLYASETLEKAEGKKRLYKEQLKHASENKETIAKSLEDKTQAMEQSEAKYNEVLLRLQKEKELLKELNKKVDEKETLLKESEEDLARVLDQAKGDYIELLNEQASIRNETRYLDEQLRQQQQKNKRLTSENEELITERETIQARLKRADEELSKAELHLEQVTNAYRETKRVEEQKKNQYHQKESKLYEAYQWLQKLESRKEVLEEMEADFSGFFQGVKEVLKKRDTHLTGVVGAVAELVHVPKQYEAALEIALGSAMQHVVVQTEADARKAIQFLKQNRFGRATFLPLSVLKPRQINEFQLQSLQNEPGFVGVAADLIQFEKSYYDVIWNLLGHIVIAENLESANKIAAKLGYRYRVVTLEGDVVNAGGSMTGGSLKQKQTPLLGRKREVEELTEKFEAMKKSTLMLEEQVKALKLEQVELENELSKLQSDGEKARADYQDKKAEKREIELQGTTIEERFKRFGKEQESYSQEEERIKERLTQLAEKEQKVESERRELEKHVYRLEGKLKNQQSSKEELQEQLTLEKIEQATVKERYTNILTDSKRLEQEKGHLKEELAELQEQATFLQEEVSHRTTGEGPLEKQISDSREDKELLSEKLVKIREDRKQLDEAYEKLEKQLKEEQAKFAYIIDQVRTIEVSVNRYDVELDNCLSTLREEYSLTYEAAKANYQLTHEVEEAKTKVKLIKLAIEELGTVNIGAIEEYERVKERYDFLKVQQEDLLEAKATLHSIISEMDEEMTKRFQETFVQIKAHFRVVFSQLFGGGDADLVLTTPDDLLNTGVEMVVRPPGKKRQNLALLSGGERALTAIALLFAILKVRPVPFCVLDEVEAALDEANVSRFAHFLKDFSRQTQFIVITHRKGTMEEADVLYGVTMQESGVSRLVSVKLEETKQLVGS